MLIERCREDELPSTLRFETLIGNMYCLMKRIELVAGQCNVQRRHSARHIRFQGVHHILEFKGMRSIPDRGFPILTIPSLLVTRECVRGDLCTIPIYHEPSWRVAGIGQRVRT